MTDIDLNGRRVRVAASPETPLLWVLRDHLGLTGTKYGCGIAACGACTVHVDGRPARSCVTRLGDVAGKRVTTIEGVTAGQADRVSRAVQSAWVRLDVPQCGYCQSGQVMAAVALLRENKRPTDAEIDDAMNGNVCRCAAYPRIRTAIKEAAAKLV
jgi:isoquinoline 1-oxidoreductase alpha subunit